MLPLVSPLPLVERLLWHLSFRLPCFGDTARPRSHSCLLLASTCSHCKCMHISCMAIMTNRRVKWTANLAIWMDFGQWLAVFSSLDCIYVLINQCIRVLKLLMQSTILCSWVSKTLRRKHLAHSKLSVVNSYVTTHKGGGHLHFSLHKAHSEMVVIIFLACKFINPSSPSVGVNGW